MSPTSILAIFFAILLLLVVITGRSIMPKQIAVRYIVKGQDPLLHVMQPIVIENKQCAGHDLEQGQPLYRNRGAGGLYNGSYKTYTS